MKQTAKEKRVAQQIINAILHGAHTTQMIIKNQGLELESATVEGQLASLECQGIIEYHNRNMAKEFGWFLTDEGQSRI